MPGVALLVFREVLETAVTVTVVVAATRRVPHRPGGGIALGVPGASVVALLSNDSLAGQTLDVLVDYERVRLACNWRSGSSPVECC